jgi:adenylate cyclase
VRIRYSFRDVEKVFDEIRDEVVLGRPRQGVLVDIDLSPDLSVSRPHARISSDNGRYWIEDLGSSNGTKLDGREIAKNKKIELKPGQLIGISDTQIVVEESDAGSESSATWNPGKTVIAARLDLSPAIDIDETLDATGPAFDVDHPVDATRAQNLALLYELPPNFGDQSGIDALLQLIVEQLMKMIAPATRGALLLVDEASGELLLKAHVPAGEPSVSLTLAHEAMTRRQAFICRKPHSPSLSQVFNHIEAGMYAPLLWKQRVLGVVCVDNSEKGASFTVEDLRLMLAVAHHAAQAVSVADLQEEARVNAVLISRLLTNFSPKIRDQMMARAYHGRLRLGGERSEVVLLESDIRGFTQLTTKMDADDVVEMLNDYFSALVDAVFKHDGTIDKFIGDGILAVFGSPEPDPNRHNKAIRAALAMHAAMLQVTAKRKAEGLVTCDLGIGIHCGEVLHGFIGSSDRMELTVIGEAVNWTARYCSGAAAGQTLISPAMHQRTWRFIDSEIVSIETKHEGMLTAYRLRGIKNVV